MAAVRKYQPSCLFETPPRCVESNSSTYNIYQSKEAEWVHDSEAMTTARNSLIPMARTSVYVFVLGCGLGATT